jgi:hypothetical protein
LPPRDFLRCISCLASLKYSMSTRLTSLLESSAAGGRAGLAGLRMQQLAALAGSLARAGGRPSNAWLVGLMQVGRLSTSMQLPPPLLCRRRRPSCHQLARSCYRGWMLNAACRKAPSS